MHQNMSTKSASVQGEQNFDKIVISIHAFSKFLRETDGKRQASLSLLFFAHI